MTSEDCFRGEVCRDGFCASTIPAVDIGDNNASNTVNDAGSDGEDTGISSDVASDTGEASNGNKATPDSGATDDVGPMGVCISDPFEECDVEFDDDMHVVVVREP